MRRKMRKRWKVRVGSVAAALLLGCGVGYGQRVADTVAQGVSRHVQTEDLTLTVTLGAGMPNPQLQGQQAELQVHHVSPVCGQGRCTQNPGEGHLPIILVHGASIDPVTGFDLQYQDYSLMDYLAEQGFDVFAMAFVGYGHSSRFTLDNPCNATLGDQKKYLVFPNRPLPGVCGGDDPYIFETIQEQESELDQLVDYARALDATDEVNLMGWSGGGPAVGVYVSNHSDKVKRVLFLASPYPSLTKPASFSGNPLGIKDLKATVGFSACLGGACCPGQMDPGLIPAMWNSVRSQDPLGATWGSADPVSGGVMRFPNAARFGWDRNAATNFTRPAMIIHGDLDTLVPKSMDEALYADLGSALSDPPNKVFIQIACASHTTVWETANHVIVREAAREWFRSGTYDGFQSGTFYVSAAGIQILDP